MITIVVVGIVYSCYGNFVSCFPSIVIKDHRPNPSLSSPEVVTLVLIGAEVTIAIPPGLYTVGNFFIDSYIIFFLLQNFLTMLLSFFKPELCSQCVIISHRQA